MRLNIPFRRFFGWLLFFLLFCDGIGDPVSSVTLVSQLEPQWPQVATGLILMAVGNLLGQAMPSSIGGLLAKPHTPDTTVVRLHLGQVHTGTDDSGGDMPAVRLYDKHGTILGREDIGHKRPPASFQDYFVYAAA